jgi:hypothetical protein
MQTVEKVVTSTQQTASETVTAADMMYCAAKCGKILAFPDTFSWEISCVY